MGKTIAVLNNQKKLEPVLASLGEALGMTVRSYEKPSALAGAINTQILPMERLALCIVTGTSRERDEARYTRVMSLLRQFGTHSRLASIPVLFLGYGGTRELEHACLDCGAEYLALPAKKSEIIERIRGMMREFEGSELESGAALTRNEGSEPQPEARPHSHAMHPSSESERRLATIMFADISGFTAMSEKMDPEEVTRVMNACFGMLEDIIKKHGGTIDKFIGDCVMVLFGVPRALENAPLQAINTAIEMRNGLNTFNRDQKLAIPLGIHIGINTGTVLAGQVGGADKKDFTVMGDTVNLASRLEDASEKGQILVGPDTYRATQSNFEYKALTPVTLKGKAEPVPVYELLSVRETVPRRKGSEHRKPGSEPQGTTDRMIYSELLGRDEEMNELRFQVMKAIKGQGGIVTIVGEAGIGKSRLMAELKSDPSMKQVILLEGRAVSMGRALSFHPIIEIYKNWAGITEDDGDSAQLSKLEKAVRAVHPAEADEIVPFTATLMGIKLTGKFAERVKGIEGEALEKLIFKNVRELMIKGSEQKPLVYYIEDLHWADTSSIELLSALFKLTDTYRILFILVFRPNYEETSDRILKTLASDFPDRYVPVVIEPLTEKETCTLIGNLMNIKGLPRQIEEQIKERAGGNPFFIEEVVRSFIDEGAVVKKGDTFQVTEKIHSVTVPLTINEVLMSRIDRLDEDTKSLIKTASVIGRNFFHKIISRVAGDVSDIDTRLSYLEDIQLIRERTRMDELEYLFKHALAQEAAYESILIQKRKELHLHVAQAIESVFRDRLHEFFGMLAFHYSKGENLDKAEEYMLKAGEEAMRSSASSEALGYYQEALAIYRKKFGYGADPARIARLEKNIGLAFFYRGQYEHALPFIERVLAHYGEGSSRNAIISFARFVKGFLSVLFAISMPSHYWRRNPTQEFNDLLTLCLIKARILSYLNPRRFFIESFFIMSRLVSYDVSKLNEGMYTIIMTSPLLSFVGLFLPLSKKILEFARKHFPPEDAKIQPAIDVSYAFYDFFSGENNFTYNNETVDRLVAMGAIYEASLHLIYHAQIAIHQGMMDKGKDLMEKMFALARDFDNSASLSIAHEFSLSYLMLSRSFNEAMKEISQARRLGLSAGLNLEHAATGIEIRVKAYQGNLENVETLIHHVHDMMRERSFVPGQVTWYYLSESTYWLARVEAVLIEGDVRSARELIRNAHKAIKICSKYTKTVAYNKTETYRFMGIYHWLLGKPRKALRWWKKSIDIGEKLGARLELSRTYFEVGKRVGPVGARQVKKIIGLTAEECLDKAEAMFREMDLQWDLEQLAKVREARYPAAEKNPHAAAGQQGPHAW